MRIKRRDFLKTVGAGACLAAAGCVSVSARASRSKPNIVLCMADDQGWGDMAYNGHPTLKTPNFDAMAAEALRFDRFYAAAPVCSPTRGSVMTGRHPNRFGCFKWGHTLRPQEITVAEALKKAGYVTGHFGKWHLGSVRKGSPVNPGASGFDEWLSAPNFFDNDPILSREGVAIQTKGESSMVTVDAALEFIGKHAATPQPFLAVVWFGSPHGPHRAIERDRKLYDDQDKRFQQFYGEITGMDRAFGKLRKGLRTLGIADDTILWYCSDNGGLPKVGTTGGRANKGSVYEGGLRVPAILEWPKRVTGHRVTTVPCNTSDIYPTLVDIVGVRMENQPPLDGISLTALIDGKMRARPEPMGFWDYPERGISTPSAKWMSELLEAQKAGSKTGEVTRLRLDAGKITTQYPEDAFPGHAAWTDWPWKLHRIQGKNEKVKWELYNLAGDPGEKDDLLTKRSDRAESMKSQLESWLKSVVRSLNGKTISRDRAACLGKTKRDPESEMIVCPSCETTLSRRVTKLGFFWFCRSCQGRALTLQTIRKAVPREILNDLWHAARSERSDGIRKCPSCRRPMAEVPVNAGGLIEQVDVCTSCQFVWFDQGEFENLPKETSQSHEAESLPYEATEALARVRLEAVRKEYFDSEVLEDSPDHWWQFFLGIFGVPAVHNYTPLRHRPIVTWSLAVIIAAVSIISFRDIESAIENWALIPGQAARHFGLTLFTSFFLHADVLHLFGNMAFLIVFGRNTEDFLGRGRYLLLIAAATIGGASAHILSSPGSAIPCIGASGGISGVIAYYCLRFPKTDVGFLHWFQWFRIRVDHMFVVWILLQMVTAFEASMGLSMLAAFAHLGGAAVGALFWLATRQTFPEVEEGDAGASRGGRP